MNDGTLVQRVLTLTDDAARATSGTARDELDSVRARLEEPLRVAVVGRIKAGKSTLVNALLRQRVAPTDVSECTKVVTWFRFGHPQRVEVRMRDGSAHDLRLDRGGRLPTDLGVPAAQVASLHVWLTNDTLRTMTLIDTPGLGSLDAGSSAATEDLLSLERQSMSATASAEAIAFVLNQNVMADELETLRAFRQRATELRGSAVNAVGVLTKADKIAGGADPWNAARRMAQRQADRFRLDVATVIPVLGLMAETAETYSLTEVDAAAVVRLAELEPEVRTPMLWSPERFLGADVPVPVETRERLLEMLDIYGLGCAFDMVARGMRGARELQRALSEHSGVVAVREALTQTFRRREDALKAQAALDLLERLTYRHGEGPHAAVMRGLRDAIEALLIDPAMHELAEMQALNDHAGGQVDLPDELADDLRRMAGGGDIAARLGVEPDARVDTLRAAALEGAGRWRAFGLTAASPRQARIGRVMARSYLLAWDAAGEPVETAR